MNRVGAALTAGVALYAAAACGPEVQEQEGRVVGFAYGIHSTIVEDRWIPHTGVERAPSGQIRNLATYEEFDHCEEVDNGFFSLDIDDEECWLDIWCDSDEDTHCAAVYEPRYNFEALEEFAVLSCPAPITRQAEKPDSPAVNTECIEQRTAGQRIEQTAQYVVWVSVNNPFYDSETNPREVLISSFSVTPEAWSLYQPNSSVPVKVADNQTVKLG